jgi:hypothetical protein
MIQDLQGRICLPCWNTGRERAATTFGPDDTPLCSSCADIKNRPKAESTKSFKSTPAARYCTVCHRKLNANNKRDTCSYHKTGSMKAKNPASPRVPGVSQSTVTAPSEPEPLEPSFTLTISERHLNTFLINLPAKRKLALVQAELAAEA